MKIKHSLLKIAVFSCLAAAYSLDAKDFVSSECIKVLETKGQDSNFVYRGKSLDFKLAPKTELSQSFVGEWKKSGKVPATIGENIYLIKKSELCPSNPDSVTIQKAGELIRSPGRMQGMNYYRKNGTVREVLYKEAYSISGLNSKTKVMDDNNGSADGKTLYCMLNDHSFGKTNYVMNYRQTAIETSGIFRTTSDMYMGPIKAVEKGNLLIGLDVTDLGDELLIYLVVQADFPAVNALEGMMMESFSSRLDAIYEWFLHSF